MITDWNLASRFVLRHVREGRGGRTALITHERRWTYAELASLVMRTANALRALGVRRGDRVLLALSDSPEFVAAWYAAQLIGAVTAEVYTFLQPKDYAYYIAYTDAVIVLVDWLTRDLVLDALAESARRPLLVCVGGDARDGEHDLDALVAEQPDTAEPALIGEDDIVIWKFTTGSTGRPKACVHSARSPHSSYEAYALGVLGMREDDVVLPVPKLFFGYARDLTAMFPFGPGGAGIVYPDRCTPQLLFDLIARHRPTILVNVPTMMQAMVDDPRAPEQDLSCLRCCTSAGEALPDALHRRWLDMFGVEVLDGIGSSEAYHIYVSNRPGRVRVGSMGEVVPGYDATVVDEGGAPQRDGAIGRLWIAGDTTARCYWGDDERTRETFDGRTVMSGDLVERDADGYFWYRGRADDLLKIGGIWVAPAEIERCITAHPDVVECAVVGVDRDGLTRASARVVLRPGVGLTEEEVRAYVRSQLAPHKVPAEVRFLDALPRTGSGKIDRAALRAPVAAHT